MSLSALLDGWFAPPSDPMRISWIGEHLYAHRGLHGAGAPENSPSAFAAALAAGYGIECDIQRSADGRAIVFHDWELGRLTGESGLVRGRTAAELGGIALAGSADRIPTLRDLLDQVRGEVPILIELKSRRRLPVAALCRAVRLDLAAYRGLHAVMSFDPRVAHWFARHAPGTVRGLVVTQTRERWRTGALRRHLALWWARPDFLAYDIRDLPSRFATRQRRRGLAVATWTVRDREQRRRAKLHADAVIAEHEGLKPLS